MNLATVEAPTDNKPERVLRGIAASAGIASGPAFVHRSYALRVPQYEVPAAQHASEVERFEEALENTRTQIGKIRDEVAQRLSEQEAKIFDAHLLVIEDASLVHDTIAMQKEQNLNIEHCFDTVSQRYLSTFAQVKDAYIRERVSDIEDVVKRVLRTLLGLSTVSLRRLDAPRVIAALDLSPSETGTMPLDTVLGIVTEVGSQTSHAVIMARSLGVPAVVGVEDLLKQVQPDDFLIIDGNEGRIYINPARETLANYKAITKRRAHLRKEFEAKLAGPSVTTCGTPIAVRANIGEGHDLDAPGSAAVEGIGLFRTETLFLRSDELPSEDEQFEAYKDAIAKANGHSVTLRTLDIGGDKRLGGGVFEVREENPFLGLRAIRFCLTHKRVFETQLRALLRATAEAPDGSVKIMYPMVANVGELIEANVCLENAKQQLTARGAPFNPHVPVGIMIELPGNAFIIPELAQHAHFFSLGTNDLVQYLLAADRTNSRVAHLYEPCHPGVLRCLQMITTAAKAAGTPVSICGEMASDPALLPLILGLGITELSMAPPSAPEIKYLCTQINLQEAQEITQWALTQHTAEPIRTKLRTRYTKMLEAL